ncbi:hypothetical protein NLI96_g9703 [Meripilus lineatus]|uniref:Bromo domain-containing protein n=1 Tax=Meripilus lineatus TaxID=2056292 RepID=A0AAD5YAQ9_9APHY|nr:hypothetical protein NLI96_g9703 [Physisporinus lineatus]
MSSGKRQKNAGTLALPTLSNLERLIFSQAVHEFGTITWDPISKLLNNHPLLKRPKNFFDTTSCSAIYDFLMKSSGFECSEADVNPRSATHLKLAKQYYAARITELKELIAAEETRFRYPLLSRLLAGASKQQARYLRVVVNEIDEIRAGNWDDRIFQALGGHQRPPEIQVIEPDQPSPEVNPPPIPDHSGHTVSPTYQEIPAVHESPKVEEIVEEEEQLEESPDLEMTAEPTPPSLEEDVVPDEIDARSTTPATPEILLRLEPDEEEAVEPIASNATQPKDEEEVQVIESPPPADIEMEQEPPEDASMAAQSQPEVSPEDVGEGSPEPPPHSPVGIEEEDVTMTVAQTEPSQSSEVVPEVTPPPELPPSRSEGKRKASESDGTIADMQRESKRPREDSEVAEEEEPGISERTDPSHSPLSQPIPGPSTVSKSRRKGQAQSEAQVVSKRFQNVIGMLHSTISQHRYGNIFHNPIKKSEAPDYHDIVKRPMDLKTIKARVKDGVTSNSLEFQRDVYLMFANAMMYNRPGSEIYNMAEEVHDAGE